jgi:hypothetical protein
MLRTVGAVRYVVPFREGGSLPALVEADDDGLYVVKLHGAGQGRKALVAEVLAGELGRAAGLPVPELAVVEIDPAFGEAEPDPEISDLLEASAGQNLGLDYLPGSVTFDPAAGPAPDAVTASRVVLFDAFVTNVDRTPKNPNLLTWHGRIWLIDHGASLYFHHGWSAADRLDGSRDPFPLVQKHVLLPWAGALAEAAAHLAATFTRAAIERAVALIPAGWLGVVEGFPDEDAIRAAYVDWLSARAEVLPTLLEEAERARANRV